MNILCYIPNSLKAAGLQVRIALVSPLQRLPHEQFIRSWSSIAYLFPGLHPDGFDESDSGWPRVLKPFAEEAWRRADADELTEDQLYCSDAQWCGLYDRMLIHMPDETERRVRLAAAFGDS